MCRYASCCRHKHWYLRCIYFPWCTFPRPDIENDSRFKQIWTCMYSWRYQYVRLHRYIIENIAYANQCVIKKIINFSRLTCLVVIIFRFEISRTRDIFYYYGIVISYSKETDNSSFLIGMDIFTNIHDRTRARKNKQTKTDDAVNAIGSKWRDW